MAPKAPKKAEEPRCVTMTAKLLDLDGKTALLSKDPGREKKEITLRDVCCASLMNVDPQRKISKEIKAQRYFLGAKIFQIDKCPLTAADIVLLMDCIGETYGPIVVGRAFEILDPTWMEKQKNGSK